jgi:hypothetical protein
MDGWLRIGLSSDDVRKGVESAFQEQCLPILALRGFPLGAAVFSQHRRTRPLGTNLYISPSMAAIIAPVAAAYKAESCDCPARTDDMAISMCSGDPPLSLLA